jgi:Ca2+-binding RTX toxin-like protein
VVAGNDRDALFVSATSSASSNANSYGMYGSKNTNTGQGDDRLIISATASSQGTATAYGLYESDLFSGEGNDQIVITSTSTSASGSGGVGAFKSRIVAGAGNDSIQVAAKERAEFDIKDSIIFGEDGDDTIDVGIGSGKLIGGAGNDLAILNYFSADTMDIALINGLIRVSGTQTKSGTQQAWTQDIFQVERFQVGDTVYSADTLAATFTA